MPSQYPGSTERIAIPGSEREPDARHPRVDDADPSAEFDITLYLRPAQEIDWVDDEAARPPAERRSLTPTQFAALHGANHDDVRAVQAFAADYNLDVAQIAFARRSMTLRGTAADMTRAFEVQGLATFEHPTHGTYRGRRGPLTVPRALTRIITGVFGIDERPQAEPHIRFHADAQVSGAHTPVEIAQAYDFPSGLTGNGQTVAIIELGGGYSDTDIDTYFRNLGLTTPNITAIGVDGGSNAPGVNQDADGEVALDIQVVGAIAPDASIVVYFAGSSDRGFLDAVSTAVHDTTHHPSVVSISWGGPEDAWTAQARAQMEQVLIEAASLGVTVTVASGDGGSADGTHDGKQHADFPASAPHALGCGGTSLHIRSGRISSERVWNDGAAGGAGGGGVSIEFPVPAYQTTAVAGQMNVDTDAPGRGVPDVSGDADPRTGYIVRVAGVDQAVGGTSAVAPLWAALAALLNESLGKPVGFLQPQLYVAATEHAAFRDITTGNNGAYQARAGWDPCTGLGSPIGTALLGALGGVTHGVAGTARFQR